MTKRITAIDIMQGIVMLLVVVGHHFFPFMPEWYRRLYYWVYTFHMPLFIFISGFLIRYSYKGVHSMAEYRSYVGRRFRKFALPYIIVGVLCALLAWNFGDVGILADNMLHLLIAPKLGEARFLWYLYLLFMFYCMAPLIFNAKNMIRWCIAGMAFYFSVFYVPSNYLCADYFTKYFVFFMFGVLVAESYIRIRKIPKRWYMVPAVVFVGMTVLHFQYGYNAILEYAMQWMGIPACACAAWGLEKCRPVRDVLVRISQNCFAIYLYHMFIIQGVAVLLRLSGMGLTAYTAIPYLLLSTALAISIPMMMNIKRKR